MAVFQQSCRITSTSLSQALARFGRALAVTGSTNNYDTVLVTVLVPSATSLEESLRVLEGVLQGLNSLCNESGVSFFFSTLELHRVVPQTDQEKKQAALEEAVAKEILGKVSSKQTGKKKKSPVEVLDLDEKHSEEVAEGRNLFGNAHLHAVIAGPRQFIRNLPLDLTKLEDIDLIDVNCRSIARTVPRSGSSAELNTGQENYYASQITNALRYIAKEYRLEAREQLFLKLSEAYTDLFSPKFKLFLSFELLEDGKENLEGARGIIQKCFLDGTLLIENSSSGALLMPPGTHVKKLNFLLEQYLRANGIFMGIEKAGGKTHSFILSTPHQGYVGGFDELAVVTPDELFNILLRFYSVNVPSGEIAEYLIDQTNKFKAMANAAAFSIPTDLRERTRVDGAILRTGGLLWWEKPKQLRYRPQWGLRQALRHERQEPSRVARIGLQQSSITLEEQLSSEVPFQHLQDYFREPNQSSEDLAKKTALFLFTLGKLIRPGSKSESAIFFYGPSGTGKTPLLQRMADQFWGVSRVKHVFIHGTNFDLEGTEYADLLIWDEMGRLSEAWKNKLKLLLSPQKVRVDRKNISAVTVSFGEKAFFFTSNYKPVEVFGKELPAMEKRCRFFYICNKPLSKKEDGYDMKALLNSTDSILLGALYLSSESHFEKLSGSKEMSWQAVLKQVQASCFKVLEPELSEELESFHPAALPIETQARLNQLIVNRHEFSSDDEGETVK